MLKLTVYTCLALIAFALNSILCRLALRGGEIDAAGFTTIRLASGAVALAAISYLAGKAKGISKRGNWFSAFFLFLYAAAFSFAYLSLTAGTGALILFGSVQLTMIGVALAKGEGPLKAEWAGLIIAAGGLVYLLMPGISSPPITGALLMAAAGAAWGIYTLRGKGSGDPLGETAGNFLRSVPFAAALVIPAVRSLHFSRQGVLLAVVSGAATSGVGYAIWYAALKHLPSSRAAIAQLAVPIIAAFCGVLFLDEVLSTRLIIASVVILGGIAAATFGGRR